MEAQLDTEKLEEEIERLRQQLERSQNVCKKNLMRADQLAITAAEEKAEVEHLRDELKSFREDASRFSREDDRKIRHLQREKQDLEKKIARLKSEVMELRAVIQQYVGELKNGIEGGVATALHTEMDLIRQQAEDDVNKMREQLEAREQSDSAGSAELEVLRQEFGSLQQSDEAHREALAQMNDEKQRLKEELEAQRGEAMRLQRALDIAREEAEKNEGRRRDQIELRKQAESSLNDALIELEQSRNKEDAAAMGFMESRVDSGTASMRQHKFIAAVFGAITAFMIAEGISILSDRGELITGLVSNNRAGSGFEFPLMEQAESARPRSGSDQEQVAFNKSASGNSNQLAPEKKGLPPVNDGLATGVTLRDRLSVGGSGPAMTNIRGGRFNMGQRRDQLASDERPLHPVELKGFFIGKYEVTFDEYQLFARATGRKMPSDQGWGKGRRPVINVTWTDATAYTRWLTGQTGITYRLPTEAEWEYAAGGGTDSFFWWGYTIGENRASCFDCGSRWDGKSTAPVGSFPANPFAIHDTAGNVMEWVADCYHVNYQGAPKDGSTWSEKDCAQYVARGGAYNKPGDSLHTTRRFHYQRDTKLPMLGFRVVREINH